MRPWHSGFSGCFWHFLSPPHPAATLIALGLSAALATALVELLDAAGGTAWTSRTPRSASAKVLLLALATAALIILLAVALFELVGPRSTWFAEVLLLLALAAATLIEIIAVALLELIGASGSARRTKVLLLVLVAVLPTVVAITPAVSGSDLVPWHQFRPAYRLSGPARG